MRRALIVEQGYSRGAVAGARALKAAGWQVGVGSPGARGLAAVSRAPHRRHDIPPAHHDLAAFLEGVDRATQAEHYEVVFGAGEAEVLALSAHRAQLRSVVPHSAHGSVLAGLNKERMEDVARDVGFAVPEILDPAVLSDEHEPLIVKATAHARPNHPGAPPRVDTNMVIGATAARKRVAELESLGAEARVQRFYRGSLLAYSAVADRGGSVVVDCMQVASRIWPPGAGASCRAETIAVDPLIAERAQHLFQRLGWFGLAELQFIVPDEEPPHLIDLNGRFYGSLCLAVAAGANLPAAWAALATDRPVKRGRARPGVTYQWLEGDLRRGLAERRGGLWTDLASSLGNAPGSVHSLASWSDPGPLVAQIAHVGREALRGRKHKNTGRGPLRRSSV